jgi:hypothetical protein
MRERSVISNFIFMAALNSSNTKLPLYIISSTYLEKQ